MMGSGVRVSLAGAIILGMAAVLAGAAAGPRIAFDESEFDFGTVYQGDTVTHRYAFRNTGDAPLTLGEIASSCGCTAGLASGKEIAPNERGEVVVTLRSAGLKDQVAKQVVVESNDPGRPRVTLGLSGFIKREVEVVPTGVYFGDLAVGETAIFEVQVRPVEVNRFRVLEITSDQPEVHAADPEPIEDARGGYRFSVYAGPVRDPGRIAATLTVHTDLPHAKELPVTVYGLVVEPTARALAAQPPAPRTTKGA